MQMTPLDISTTPSCTMNAMKFIREWIDKHPDTMMMSAPDHESGGLTLSGFNPLPLEGASMTTEHAEML